MKATKYEKEAGHKLCFLLALLFLAGSAAVRAEHNVLIKRSSAFGAERRPLRGGCLIFALGGIGILPILLSIRLIIGALIALLPIAVGGIICACSVRSRFPANTDIVNVLAEGNDADEYRIKEY